MLSEVGGLKSFSKPTLEMTYTRKTFVFLTVILYLQVFEVHPSECVYVCVCLCICVCILGACVRFI